MPLVIRRYGSPRGTYSIMSTAHASTYFLTGAIVIFKQSCNFYFLQVTITEKTVYHVILAYDGFTVHVFQETNRG